MFGVITLSNKSSKADRFFSNKVAVVVVGAAILAVLFFAAFFLTTFIFTSCSKEDTTDDNNVIIVDRTEDREYESFESTKDAVTTTEAETTTEQTTTSAQVAHGETPGNVEYPADDASWKLICLNRNYYVGSSVEDAIDLSYVAGSGELMDSRAAAAYDEMYNAAAEDGIYLTPCSGYRSYSTQKRLYNEFFYEYINDGYSEEEAHYLTSKRRNPPGSSEHNIGICMDIICASSSANFQNTQAYAWLQANAHNYGFILRYPEDKVAITGVKFEPWHWRYVGVENAASIKNSGLCLEEYLGLA